MTRIGYVEASDSLPHVESRLNDERDIPEVDVELWPVGIQGVLRGEAEMLAAWLEAAARKVREVANPPEPYDVEEFVGFRPGSRAGAWCGVGDPYADVHEATTAAVQHMTERRAHTRVVDRRTQRNVIEFGPVSRSA